MLMGSAADCSRICSVSMKRFISAASSVFGGSAATERIAQAARPARNRIIVLRPDRREINRDGRKSDRTGFSAFGHIATIIAYSRGLLPYEINVYVCPESRVVREI